LHYDLFYNFTMCNKVKEVSNSYGCCTRFCTRSFRVPKPPVTDKWTSILSLNDGEDLGWIKVEADGDSAPTVSVLAYECDPDVLFR